MRFEIIFYTLLLLTIVFFATSATFLANYWKVIKKHEGTKVLMGVPTFICGVAAMLFICITGAIKMDNDSMKRQLKHIEQQDTCPKFEQIQEPLYRKL